MNSVHDMGGMHGFGPIPLEENEPVFHADWEARAMALRLLMGAWGKWSLDAGRHANESLSLQQYLNLSYYERWITSLADLAVNAELITLDEVKNGRPAPGAEKLSPPIGPEGVRKLLANGRPASRKIESDAKFSVGDRVRTNVNAPEGHTRLPRYARGRVGDVILYHGAHVFPDSHAHFNGENPDHLYTVRFSGRDLWGEQANDRDFVHLEMWESYIDGV